MRVRKSMSLRWRLTLFYSALSALTVVLAGVAFFVVLRQNLQSTLDTSLRESATLAGEQLRDEQQGKFSETETDTLFQRMAAGTSLRVLDSQGQDIDEVGNPVAAPLVEGYSTVGDQRVYTLRLGNGDWIQATRSRVETVQAIGRAQRLLLAGLPFLLLIGFGVGYFVADAAFKPVDRVTGLANHIATSGKFNERVPERPGDDEMAKLTRTFNQMLGQLESTLGREKAFALAAAHELRTPLTFIQGRASLSLEKPRSPEQYQDALRQIHSTSQEMAQMVDSLLTLARTKHQAKREVVSFKQLLPEVIENSKLAAQQRFIALELQASHEVSMHGDATALKLALSNLVQNAIKYGRSNGHVWLECGQENNEVFLAVSDDGPGIPETELDRLRQPFQRGAGLQGVSGSGLGLALVSAVAEQHGGRLELSRASQGGLRATLWLPEG
jgi:signal transduction histidine kinase